MSNPSGKHKTTAGGDSRTYWLDDPKNVRKVILVFFVSCAICVALDFVFMFTEHGKHLSFHHGELPMEGWFGFYAIYGFVACVLLVLVAKQLRKVLMRSEDYYDHE